MQLNRLSLRFGLECQKRELNSNGELSADLVTEIREDQKTQLCPRATFIAQNF